MILNNRFFFILLVIAIFFRLNINSGYSQTTISTTPIDRMEQCDMNSKGGSFIDFFTLDDVLICVSVYHGVYYSNFPYKIERNLKTKIDRLLKYDETAKKYRVVLVEINLSEQINWKKLHLIHFK